MKQPRDSNESESQENNTKRQRWTEEETQYLKMGVKMFGEGQWKQIKEHFSKELSYRTNVQIKDRWRTLQSSKVKRQQRQQKQPQQQQQEQQQEQPQEQYYDPQHYQFVEQQFLVESQLQPQPQPQLQLQQLPMGYPQFQLQPEDDSAQSQEDNHGVATATITTTTTSTPATESSSSRIVHYCEV